MGSHGTDHPHATVGTGRCGNYEWFDPTRAVEHAWGRHLPHWRQPGAIYFVTFRTTDSIPFSVVEWRKERARWLATHPEPRDGAVVRDFHRCFTRRMHRFLDACHGTCRLRDSVARQFLVEVFHTRDCEDYTLDAYAVMPDHAHVLVCPGPDHELSAICKAWKGISGRRVNRLLGLRGGFWQQESWDHLVRTPDHLDRFRDYIRVNPSKLPRL